MTRGSPPPTPNPPGTFSFAALGDAPYYEWESIQYRLVLQSLDVQPLSFVVHVGDIFWHPCSDEHYRKTLGRLNGLRHPVVYTPGDNEWADCWEAGSGAYAPRERLNRLREIFFQVPTQSLGLSRLPLVSQAGSGSFAEFVENVRWEHEGIMFATVHLVGSMNAMKAHRGHTPADDSAARRRTEAAAAWLRETFAQAEDKSAQAVVIAFHAAPAFESAPADSYRSAYEPFMAAFEEEVERFGKPVLVIHGDDHTYIVDHPLVSRTSGRRLNNLTRLEVPGSPDVGWVRVVVRPGAQSPFSFENRVVPAWKYW